VAVAERFVARGGLGPAAVPLGGLALGLATGAFVIYARVEYLGLAAVGAMAAACFVFWRQGVYAVFVVVAIEGFVRNLVDTPQVLLIKDVMLIAIYVRVFGERLVNRQSLLPAHPANIPLLLFCGVVLVQALNPNVASIDQAVVGIRTWIFYLPLFYVAGEMFRHGEEVWRFFTFLLLLAIPLSITAIYQVIAGPSAYSALGDSFAQATFVVNGDPNHAGAFRPNSTFAWSSHFAIFIAVATILACGYMLREAGWRKSVALALLAFLAAINVVEGQRTFFLLLPPILLLMVLWHRTATTAVVLLGVALAVGAVLVNVVAYFGSDGGNALDRPLALFSFERDSIAEHAGAYLSTFIQAVQASPIGLGAGATSIGTRHALGYIPLFVESVPAKVAGDLSLVGLAVFGWLVGTLIWRSVKAHRGAMRSGDLALAARSLAVLGAQVLIVYTGTEIAVAAMLFWLLSGSLPHHSGEEVGGEAPAQANV
jgi:hypothetical protein